MVARMKRNMGREEELGDVPGGPVAKTQRMY